MGPNIFRQNQIVYSLLVIYMQYYAVSMGSKFMFWYDQNLYIPLVQF